jgi:dihydroorotase-like cyclic amidohydrolase
MRSVPGGNTLRVKPPVREAGHAAALWAAVLDGTIDMISTDHAPHPVEEKHRASIWETSPGFPGVETSMRLMLTEVAAGRLTLQHYVRLACEAPARAFGLWPRKGALMVGADADLVLLDLAHRAPIRGATFQSMGKVTPFEGRETQGRAAMTFLRGTCVAQDGQVIAPPGTGRPLRTA